MGDNQEFAGGLQKLTAEMIAMMAPEKLEELFVKAGSVIIEQDVALQAASRAAGVPEGAITFEQAQLFTRGVREFYFGYLSGHIPFDLLDKARGDTVLWNATNSVFRRLAAPSAPSAAQDDRRAGELEPDMVWDADDPEEGGHSPAEFADYVAGAVGEVSEFEVMVAVSLPNRHMRVWRERDEDGHHEVRWEWVDRAAIAKGGEEA